MSTNVRETLIDMTNAPDCETLWDIHSRVMAGYGFDRLLYGYTHFRSGNSLGDPDDFVVLSNHDSAYLDRFFGENMYFNAPMVAWALENDGAASWRLMHEMARSGTMTDSERRIYDFNQEMGVSAGYSASFRSISPRSKGAIALTATRGTTQSEVDAIWEEHGRDLLLLNNVAHLKITGLPNRNPRVRSLTPRQREALEWVGDGKTTQDIAVIMGLSPGTVEKHLRLARETLNVETTAQAVLKASFQNQMFILDR